MQRTVSHKRRLWQELVKAWMKDAKFGTCMHGCFGGRLDVSWCTNDVVLAARARNQASSRMATSGWCSSFSVIRTDRCQRWGRTCWCSHGNTC
jgi:hypothetical protein